MASDQGQPDPHRQPGFMPGQQPPVSPPQQGWIPSPPQNPPQGPPLGHPPKRRSRLRVVLEVVGGLVLLFIGVAIGSAGNKAGSHSGSNASDVSSAQASATSAPAVPAAAAPSPNGTYQGSCDYTLATDPSGDNYLIGEVDVTNTGNIGTIVKVKITWPQEGYAPITARKIVHVPYGATGFPVRFHVNAGSIDSGSQVIDLLQSYQNSHSGTGCTYDATITRTFGKAH